MNQSNLTNHQPATKSLARLFTGLTFAYLIYQLALNFATGDCNSLQSEVRSGGIAMIATILSLGTIISLLGIPAAFIAGMAGTLMGPVSGASMASLAITLGSLLAWAIARYTCKGGFFPIAIEQRLRGQWYNTLMDDKTTSGFHWILSNAISCPLPFAYFAAITGAKVRHLNAQSLAAGIFASTVFYVAAYALAGASIGCAAINHASGFDISQYRPMMIISCILLVILARLQTYSRNRSLK